MKSPVLNFWAYLNGDGDELNISAKFHEPEFEYLLIVPELRQVVDVS